MQREEDTIKVKGGGRDSKLSNWWRQKRLFDVHIVTEDVTKCVYEYTRYDYNTISYSGMRVCAHKKECLLEKRKSENVQWKSKREQ